MGSGVTHTSFCLSGSSELPIILSMLPFEMGLGLVSVPDDCTFAVTELAAQGVVGKYWYPFNYDGDD